MRATAVGSSGSAPVAGGEMKAAFGWYDQRVWINSNHTITGAIRERYDKLDCRPGLPDSPLRTVPGGSEQYFANGGLYRNSAADLTVWLRGSIDREFRAVDAVRGIHLAPGKSDLRDGGEGVRGVAGGRVDGEPGGLVHDDERAVVVDHAEVERDLGLGLRLLEQREREAVVAAEDVIAELAGDEHQRDEERDQVARIDPAREIPPTQDRRALGNGGLSRGHQRAGSVIVWS